MINPLDQTGGINGDASLTGKSSSLDTHAHPTRCDSSSFQESDSATSKHDHKPGHSLRYYGVLSKHCRPCIYRIVSSNVQYSTRLSKPERLNSTQHHPQSQNKSYLSSLHCTWDNVILANCPICQELYPMTVQAIRTMQFCLGVALSEETCSEIDYHDTFPLLVGTAF